MPYALGLIGRHLDAATCQVLASAVWESVEAHTYRGAGSPRVPRRGELPALEGVAPNANGTFWQSITLRGSGDHTSEVVRGRGWGSYDGPLVLVWNAARGAKHELVVPIKLVAPGTAAGRRQRHSLGLSGQWRAVTLVRRVAKGRVRSEAHLLVAAPAYVPAGRYEQAPDAIVGADLGVSSVACVAVDERGMTGSLLARVTPDDRATERAQRQVDRRRQRALERSRRATNPEAYGPDSNGRAGRGSRKRGHRLRTSKAYRQLRAEHAEQRRRIAEERTRWINELAKAVVGELGRHLVVEDVQIRNWARLWGSSVARFAPSQVKAAPGTRG